MHTEIKDLHHALDHTTADLHAAESTSHDEWNTCDLAETMLKDLEQRIKNDQLCATALASCASGHPIKKDVPMHEATNTPSADRTRTLRKTIAVAPSHSSLPPKTLEQYCKERHPAAYPFGPIPTDTVTLYSVMQRAKNPGSAVPV